MMDSKTGPPAQPAKKARMAMLMTFFFCMPQMVACDANARAIGLVRGCRIVTVSRGH
jgi:hypothetical protein